MIWTWGLSKPRLESLGTKMTKLWTSSSLNWDHSRSNSGTSPLWQASFTMVTSDSIGKPAFLELLPPRTPLNQDAYGILWSKESTLDSKLLLLSSLSIHWRREEGMAIWISQLCLDLWLARREIEWKKKVWELGMILWILKESSMKLLLRSLFKTKEKLSHGKRRCQFQHQIWISS